MNTPRTLTALLAATATLSLAACGGGSSSSAQMMSKDAYITKADAMCLKASKAEDAIPQPQSPAQLTGYVRRVYALERGVVVHLRALRPPAGDSGTIERMLDSVDRALAFESDVEQATRTGNQSQINDAQARGAKYLNRASTIASRYGFTECGNT
jgi:hypothetical protein